MLDTRRRHFITLLGGAAAALPLAAGGKQPTCRGVPRVRITQRFCRSFARVHVGLGEVGYVEGGNVATTPRTSWALFNSPASLSSSGDFEIGSSLSAGRQPGVSLCIVKPPTRGL